jgi:predicted DNA-binding transcriptional regulator AlpA
MSKQVTLPSDSLSPIERYKQLSTKQVMEYIGVSSPASVWNYVKEGKLPKPRYLSPHKPIWQLGEVIDHIEEQLATYEDEVRAFKGDAEALRARQEQVGRRSASRILERLGLRKRS